MEDSRPTVAYYEGANAGVVEGLGSLSCSGSYYSKAQIEDQTVSWIDQDLQTITEISPQTTCGSLSDYETLLNDIASYVEKNASDPGRYWGGLMLDEEPGFGFSASQLETLNGYVASLMGSTSGVSYYFTEDQPNGWTTATYNSVVSSSWLAPQVYSQGSDSMATAVNEECSTYNQCINLVTVDPALASPMNSPTYVTGLIDGTPWSDSTWGTGYWYNKWRAQ